MKRKAEIGGAVRVSALILSACLSIILATAFIGLAADNVPAQNIAFKREQADIILEQAAHDVEKHYFDPNLHGLDWAAKLAETKGKIANATSSNLAFANIAALIDSLDDSHTFFIPPPRSFSFDYGWRMQAVGDKCFITHVRPQADASTKLQAGDEILQVNDYKLSRLNLYRVLYVLNVLRPQSKVDVSIRSGAGDIRQVEISPKIFPGQLIRPGVADLRMLGELSDKRARPRLVALSDDVLLVRIPTFWINEDEVNKILDRARKFKSVILDLRGNGGGPQDSLRSLLGAFFDHDVKIGDEQTRKSTKILSVKPDRHSFSGTLIVLVDSWSRSAAEIFARVVQLEKRGIILGDRTAGMVMGAEVYSHASLDSVFGVSVTVADLIMSDGKRLEHVGVFPDQVILPTAEDLANERDPVLARAAADVGFKLSPTEAGRLFPYEWEVPPSIAGVGSWF
jgi:C-terminal processing protease CtpA/Prc